MSMWKLLKEHFATKKGFHRIRAESTFSIRIQDGTYFHLFTIKITEEGSLYTKFQVQSHVSKEVFKFIQRFDVDIPDHTYIPERDRYFMLVLNNELKWFGFSPFQHMTLSLYQAERLIKQIYEIKYLQYCNVNKWPAIIESDVSLLPSSYPTTESYPRENN